MHRITGSPLSTVVNQAEKVLGRLKADLDYTDIEEVVSRGMHEFLDDFQKKLNKVDDAVNCTFFKMRPSMEQEQASQ